MNLKTYQADSMAKALVLVKKDLGPDAIILNTRTLKVGGMLGVGARSRVEITATDQVDVLQSARRRPKMSQPWGKSTSQADGAAVNDRTTNRSPQSADSLQAASTDVAFQNMTGEVTALKSMVQSLVAESRKSRLPQLPESLCELYEELISRDVADELAHEFIIGVADELTGDQAADRELVRRRLRKKIESMLPADPMDEGIATNSPRIVALIGPTGVGKTTTIAKLAANSRLREKKRVGLLTTDTYRIAAVEQLRTYAKIIDVPVEVAVTPDEVAPALKRMANCDVIYIDTAGRSQNDAPRLDELNRFLKAAQPHQIHLVLSGAAGHKTLSHTAERFKTLGVSSIIFTKLDEAVGFGVILNVLRQVDRNLAFVTNGQNVPNDIQKADGANVAEWILGQKEHPDSSAVDRNGATHDQGV
jgi:flagellar biosynthesis protein FlhF